MDFLFLQKQFVGIISNGRYVFRMNQIDVKDFILKEVFFRITG